MLYFFNMAKGNSLSVEKKAIIEVYEELQLSIIEISKPVSRSRKVIDNFLHNKSECGRNNKGGNKKEISDVSKR